MRRGGAGRLASGTAAWVDSMGRFDGLIRSIDLINRSDTAMPPANRRHGRRAYIIPSTNSTSTTINTTPSAPLGR